VRAVLLVTLGIGCAFPAPRPLPKRPEPVFPAMPTYTGRIVDLRTTLARAGIRLETRGTEQVISTGWCDSEDPAKVSAGCTRCELMAETDPFELAVIEALTIAIDRYPTNVLDAAKIESVALCRRFDQARTAGHIAGTADLQGRRLLINLESFGEQKYDPDEEFTVEDIVHHELYHLLEYATMEDMMTSDTQWGVLNPSGFEYRDPASGHGRPSGFVNVYATTSPLEDRASVFQFLMARPTELCSMAEGDPVVLAKATLVWNRVATVAGDEALRLRATCATWNMSRQPTPAPVHAEPSRFVKQFSLPDKNKKWLTPAAGKLLP